MISSLKKRCFGRKLWSLVDRFTMALTWVEENTVPNLGICVSSSNRAPYPEVSGYFIPSLLNWGERELAGQYGRWLADIQNADGSWSDPSGISPYTFDTGQILKGLLALADNDPGLVPVIRRGCDWLLTQIRDDGRVVTPDIGQWQLPGERRVPEAIHLYALQPLREVGEKWGEVSYTHAVDRALEYYLSAPGVGNLSTLSHFHAYIVEAFLDLGCYTEAVKAMAEVASFQRKDGAVPAYKEEQWVCSTGLFQYALIWYRLGEISRADRAFSYACTLQNRSGGFYGGYGLDSNYFKDAEISWAVKYFLDALWWKIRTSFNTDATFFPELIEKKDGRYALIEGVLKTTRPTHVLDAGCGKGRFIRRLAEDFPEPEFFGLDLSEKMLDSLPDSVNRLHGSVLNVPVKDKAFDLVFCVETLEHAVNVPAAIAELVRVLSPNGQLVIVDKNRKRQGALEISEWEQWFDAAELAGLIENNGLDVQVIKNISYNGKDGRDGLFIGWICKRR